MSELYAHHSNFSGEWYWKNFTPAEVSCKHCGEFRYDFKAMTALQLLRDRWGKPVIIHSAHRCAQHNERVGGAKASRHLEIAFDCRCLRSDQPAFARMAWEVGFTGIIQYPGRGFVHLDLREKPYQEVVW